VAGVYWPAKGCKQHSLATTEIQKAIEKLGPEERAQLWTWFQEAEEIDELVAAIDEGIQAAEEGRVFSLEEIKMQMQSWITK
jgi:predicted transcriptional regulator